MNMLKRSLAVMLVLCMMFSAVPFTAFATESTDVTSEPTTAVVDAPASEPTVPETSVPETSVPEASVPETSVPETSVPETSVPETSVPETSVPVPSVPETTVPVPSVPETTVPVPSVPETTVSSNAADMTVLSPDAGIATASLDDGIAVASITMGTKPADGSTTGEPFPKGTGTSNSFRIPALVTLANGNLVAAADARWNTTCDGGGLDTVVSRSTDNGDTWSYTFANYLGDNGNTYNGSGSTAFIDPALAVDGNTVYMLVDLYPYGVALNGSGNTAPSSSTGFNSKGYLKLTTSTASTFYDSDFTHYLNNGLIYANNGTVVSGYSVDAKFNISYNGEYVSNLFFSDAPYKVARTGFLYLTKSTDGGKTWSDPTLLNLKTTAELVCLVGPGRGLVTSSGKIVFPVYSYGGGQSSQQTGFIYSTDNGASWKRSANFTGASWSSEAAVVELTDGTLRFFYRNGTTNLCYVDYNMSTNSWGSAVNTGLSTNSNCQISAIEYSKTIDGKQVILVSCPTGPNEAGSDQSGASYRLNGKIFLGTVADNGTMTWNDTTIALDSQHSSTNFFMYSCLTELAGGNIAVLYEDNEAGWGTGDDKYYQMTYDTFNVAESFGVTFDSEPETTLTDKETKVEISAPGLTSISVSAGTAVKTTEKVSKTYSITLNNGNYKEAATVKIPYDNAFDGCNAFAGFVDGDQFPVTKEGDFFICEVPHFSDVDIEGYANAEDTITSSGSGTATSYVLDTDGLDVNAQYLIVYNGNALTNEKGSLAVTVNGNNATPSGDASSALWTYTATVFGDTHYSPRLSNGSNYLYTSVTGNWNNRQYNLVVDETDNTLTITSNNDGTYTVYRRSSSINAYVAYNGGWKAQNSSQNLSFYKYTAGTQTYTLDAAEQESTIKSLTLTTNTGYTDESWNAYQTALTAAQNKLAAVEAAAYASETAAQTALDELKTTVTALEEAKNALVLAVSVAVHYVDADGKTVKTEVLKVAETATTATLPAYITTDDGDTYSVSNTTLTLTGASRYDVSVTKLEGTPITLPRGNEQEISVTLASGQYVKWSSDDNAYVGVAGVYNTSSLAYTNEAVLKGVQKTTSPVAVLGTVYNADGSVAYVQKWIVTVTDPDGSFTPVYRYYEVDQIESCTLYYSINGGDLIQINGTGLAIDYIDPQQNDTPYTVMDGAWYDDMSLIFFAAPDEGYALTHMYVEDSANQYYVLSDGNADGTGSSAWPLKDGVSADAVYTSGGHTYSLSEVASLYLLNNKTIYEAIKASGNVWKSLDTNNDGTVATNEYHGLRWALLEGYMDINRLKELYTEAIALGCTGVTTVTKGATNNSGIGTSNDPISICAVAQKLPTLEKKISSITKADGSTITGENVASAALEIGDTLHYSLDVTVYATDSVVRYWDGTTLRNGNTATISYSNINVTDSMYDLNWSSTKTTSATSSTSSDQHLTANYSIKLAASNWLQYVDNGVITNTAELTYHYVAGYGTGNYGGSANAAVEAYVVLPEYVLDFGSRIEIDLTNDPLVQGYDRLKSATAQYGDISFDANTLKLTYTPNQILPGMDFIRIEVEDTNGSEDDALVGYGVRIYPATTVFYEEGFLFDGQFTGSWDLSKSIKATTAKQTSEKLSPPTYDTTTGAITGYTSGKVNAYGYDPLYANTGTNGSYATSTTVGDLTIFTFTGEGFELYANSASGENASGYVTVQSKGAVSKLYTINTELNGGTTDATNNQAKGTMYNSLPIISETNLPHGTYTVAIQKSHNSAPLYIDGIRIINTLSNSTPFTIDEEDDPHFYQVRDMVLKGINIDPAISQDYKTMYQQVYDNTIAVDASAVITSAGADYLKETTAQDLLDNGPKNELYLYNGQTLTFKVKTDRVLQLGLKAPEGSAAFDLKVNGNNVTYKVNGAATTLNSLNTPVDMFYKIAEKGGDEHLVTVTNTGDKVLSVTLLKVCDDPNFSFVPLNEDDITAILAAAGYTDDEVVEPEVPETPTEPSKPTEPTEPSKPTEPEVEETKPSKPGNNKPGNNKPGKPSKPNKPGKDEEKADKVATLKVTYVSLFGRKVGTATLTKEGTGRCTFSPAEIRAAAPAGRRAIWVIPTMINYGTSASIVVPVI